MSKARFRIHRSRAFSLPALVIAVAATAPAQGQTRDCDGLPEADRQLCRMMRACAAIDDPERRRECFRAVVEAGPDTPPDEDVGRPAAPREPSQPVEPSATAATPGEPAAASETSEPATSAGADERPVPASTASTPGVTAAPAVDGRDGRKRGWGSRIRSLPVVGRLVPGGRGDRESRDAPDPPGEGTRAIDDAGVETVGASSADATVVGSSRTYEVLDIPKRFTATVSAIHNPGRNRRLVALDRRLLFVSDRGGEGRLKVGDEVGVRKTSGVFGRKYRITGPSRRPFTALRIRCEHPDLNEENRRRCLLLSK